MTQIQYDRLILEKLLAKYEASAHYRGTATAGRRVLLKLGPKSRDLEEYDIENTDQKTAVHAAIEKLAGAALIEYEWERFNRGNVLALVWLNLEKIDIAYTYLGLPQKRVMIQSVIARMDQILAAWGICVAAAEMSEISNGSGKSIQSSVSGMLDDSEQMVASDGSNQAVKSAVSDALDSYDVLANQTMGQVNQTWIIPGFVGNSEQNLDQWPSESTFTEHPDLAMAVLDMLQTLARQNFADTYIRVFSIQCFHDSKYFEQNMRSRLISLIRRYHHQIRDLESEDIPSDDDLLRLVGLYRNAEIYEFCGPLKMTFRTADDSVSVDFSVFRHGACLGSASVNDLMAVDTSQVSRILFIENRTNYDAYIKADRKLDELVIYHGGFHGPTKLRFFQKLVSSLAACIEVYHWGDIDLGGLKIFLQIRRAIAPELKPWRMDQQTLLAMQAKAIFYHPTYRSALEQAVHDPQFADFRDLLETMLMTGLRLEQEAFI